MRVFVTGASRWIGSATVSELLAAGHQVIGLARSDAAAERVAALGAEVARGDLDDPKRLAELAAAAEAVVHLAYIHDFSKMQHAAEADRATIDSIGEALAGTDHPFVIASGLVGLSVEGRPATEQNEPDTTLHPRLAAARATLDLAERGVRSAVVRFAPTVHGAGDHGFMATLVGIARDKGVSAFIGDGANRWPAVQRLDAGNLVRRVVDDAPAGSVWHAVAEQGVPTRDIAEAIGRGLNLPVVSISPDQAGDHFGWIGMFFGMDVPASSELTRDKLGWQPTGPGLLADLDAGHYFS